jgi:uncharacterized protein (DUF983 family)
MTARLWAILRLRCPRCFRGKVFKGSFAMNDPCPVCGLILQREEGYFLGAMYVSYIFASVILVPLYLAGQALWPSLSPYLLMTAVTILYLPLVPAVFRYSRIIWMHFERSMCPSDLSATVYEKARQREFERQRRAALPQELSQQQASGAPDQPDHVHRLDRSVPAHRVY